MPRRPDVLVLEGYPVVTVSWIGAAPLCERNPRRYFLTAAAREQAAAWLAAKTGWKHDDCFRYLFGEQPADTGG